MHQNNLTVIGVIYTKHKLLTLSEVNEKTRYYFYCNYDVQYDDMLESPDYKTPMQVIEIRKEFDLNRELKVINLTKINGKPAKLAEIVEGGLTHTEKAVPLINDCKIGIGNVSTAPISACVADTTAYNKWENLEKQVTELINSKTENKMENKKSMFKSYIEKYKSQFMPVKEENVKISMTGNICVKQGDEYVGIDSNNDLVTYPEEMCLDFPVYTLSKSFDKVEVGDIIKVKNSFTKVIRKNKNGSLGCLAYTGCTHNNKEIKDFMLGQSFVKVVINMFSGIGQTINPMMLMMMDKENFDIKDILMMQMMQGQSNMNPMMLMLLSDDNKDNSTLETMMMMQMMNPNMSNIFNMSK